MKKISGSSLGAATGGFEVPCGQCEGCLTDRARQWSVRLVHEHQLHKKSEFVTLTYDDEHLPECGSLRRRDMQLFMKRLRKSYGMGVRFFGCGEYGGHTFRPHYHILLFGLAFEDRKQFKRSASGEWLYRSRILEKLWCDDTGLIGNCTTGDVTAASARYVAGYCVKKLKPEVRGDRCPEFIGHSQGIGRGWFAKYGDASYIHDSVILGEAEVKPPRYYDKLMERSDPEFMETVKKIRRRDVDKAEQTPERRRVRAKVLEANNRLFRREL